MALQILLTSFSVAEVHGSSILLCHRQSKYMSSWGVLEVDCALKVQVLN